MKAQWRVPASRPLADFAPTIILKAKDFATEITIHNARTQSMSSEPQISQEHVTNNQAVRQTLLSRGIRPESLPPAEDVKKVERRLSSAEKTVGKNPDGLEGELWTLFWNKFNKKGLMQQLFPAVEEAKRWISYTLTHYPFPYFYLYQPIKSDRYVHIDSRIITRDFRPI